MSRFIFLNNNLPFISRKISVDDSLIKLHSSNNFFNRKYIRFSSDRTIADIAVELEYHRLASMVLVLIPFLKKYNRIFENNYITLCDKAIVLELINTQTEYENYIYSDRQLYIELYTNKLIIYFSQKNNAHYISFEENTGTIYNKNFEVNALIINLSEKEYNLLQNCSNTRQSKLLNFNIEHIKELIINPMHNQKIILKIFELNNINIWQLLSYGLSKELIDNKFVIDVAVEWLNADREATSFVVELAGLPAHETQKVKQLLESFSVITPQEVETFNKIWFYLGSLNNMYELNVLPNN